MRISSSVFSLVFCCALLAVSSAVGAAPRQGKAPLSEISQEIALYNAGTPDIERDGQRLFDAYQRGDMPSDDIANVARAAVHDFCPFKYRTLWVDNGATASVYLIAEKQDAALVWGRHYRVDIDKASIMVKSVTPSTISCFAMEKAAVPHGSQVMGATTTHLLSETPTEFHAFLSLQTGQSVYVATSNTIWKVENGKIGFLQQSSAQGGSAAQ